MSIILKYIYINMKEKKLRSLLIIMSLTVSVIVLTLCLTLKDNILEKYTEFLMKTSGTSDILLTKDIPFEKNEIEKFSDNYRSVPYLMFSKDKSNIIGVNVEDLQENKMIKAERTSNLDNDEVIISKKIAENKNIKLKDKSLKDRIKCSRDSRSLWNVCRRKRGRTNILSFNRYC